MTRLKRRLSAEIRESSFTDDDVAETILEGLREVVGIGAVDDQVTPGRSKIGGRPHLPPGVEWPSDGDGNRMAFVVQLNLAELDSDGHLPEKGLLLLFSTIDESNLSDPEVDAKLLFVPNPQELVEAPYPDDLDETEGRFVERPLAFATSFLVSNEDDSALAELDYDDEQTLDAILEELGCHREAYMLGRPYFFNEELDDLFDPDDDVLLLKLHGSSVWREDDDASIFGEGSFNLIVPADDALDGKLGDALIVFESGT